jgi:hypothetical protein
VRLDARIVLSFSVVTDVRPRKHAGAIPGGVPRGTFVTFVEGAGLLANGICATLAARNLCVCSSSEIPKGLLKGRRIGRILCFLQAAIRG